INKIQGVKWITASDLPVLYSDPIRTVGCMETEVDTLAGKILTQPGSLDYQIIGNRAYSLADQFEILTLATSRLVAGPTRSSTIIVGGLFGPAALPPAEPKETHIKWTEFRDALSGVVKFIQKERRVPERVFIGPDPVPPADFLYAMAEVWSFYRKHRL